MSEQWRSTEDNSGSRTSVPGSSTHVCTSAWLSEWTLWRKVWTRHSSVVRTQGRYGSEGLSLELPRRSLHPRQLELQLVHLR